ncbi:MAG: hypothetical protein O2816_19160 [Planctomycetota bacterium]|nr:hypothetical protein [Planctomycetota bacterium]
MTASSAVLAAIERLHALLKRVEAKEVTFGEYERESRAVLAQVGRSMDAVALQGEDIDEPVIWIDGVRCRRVGRWEAPYLGFSGEIRVERSLYRPDGEERTLCPLELCAGIIEGYWTPAAASFAMWSVAHLTPAEASELFRRSGGMDPSRSTLDRLPKALSEGWEAQRTRFEESVRVGDEIPESAVAVVVSLDGILVPMKDGKREQKRQAARSNGKETRGPAGYREASCGTLSFIDAEGERVGETRYLGRMPEKNKKTLKESLEDELLSIMEQRPELKVVAVADGARDNWTWLERAMPEGSVLVLDFFHAAEHLKRAMDCAYGKDSPETLAEFARLRLLLRDHPEGAQKVINALAYQRKKYPRRKALKTELTYFRLNKPKMAYAEVQSAKLPIGSGIVEAANKTLVTVRMKRAGARWSINGGQGVLTFRALAKSGRFDRAWALVEGTYVQQVDLNKPAKVLPFRRVA